MSTAQESGNFTLPPVVRSPELAQPLAYQAICATCPDWLGPRRTNDQVALRDFDRHVLTVGHERQLEAIENAAEDQRILSEMDAEKPVTARCGWADPHGAHVYLTKDRKTWCGGNQNVVRGIDSTNDDAWTRYRNGEGE